MVGKASAQRTYRRPRAAGSRRPGSRRRPWLCVRVALVVRRGACPELVFGFVPTSLPELVAALAREGAPAAPIDSSAKLVRRVRVLPARARDPRRRGARARRARGVVGVDDARPRGPRRRAGAVALQASAREGRVEAHVVDATLSDLSRLARAGRRGLEGIAHFFRRFALAYPPRFGGVVPGLPRSGSSSLLRRRLPPRARGPLRASRVGLHARGMADLGARRGPLRQMGRGRRRPPGRWASTPSARRRSLLVGAVWSHFESDKATVCY